MASRRMLKRKAEDPDPNDDGDIRAESSVAGVVEDIPVANVVVGDGVVVEEIDAMAGVGDEEVVGRVRGAG